MDWSRSCRGQRSCPPPAHFSFSPPPSSITHITKHGGDSMIYETPPPRADKRLPRRPATVSSPFVSGASPVPKSGNLDTTLDLRTPPSTPAGGSRVTSTIPPKTPTALGSVVRDTTDAPARSVAAAVARPDRPNGRSSASVEHVLDGRCDIYLDDTLLLSPPQSPKQAKDCRASIETTAGDELLPLLPPSTQDPATAIGIERTSMSVSRLSRPDQMCSSGAGESSSESCRFPWLTPAQETQERAWSVEPWERVFNMVDVGLLVPGCHISLYNTDKLVTRASPLTAHCYIQYFLQWRLFKDPESKKAFKVNRGPLCQQWNAFCMNSDEIIKSIPTLRKAYRKSNLGWKQQLHRQSLDAHIACECLGFCPCCTGSNFRFDHKFRSHPDYSLLDGRLLGMIAREADPTHTSPADLNESLDFLIQSMKEHAYNVTNVLSGLKRKASE